MKNKALISLSFLVLFGVSACSSTSSQKPQKSSNGNSAKLKQSSSSSVRPQNSGSSIFLADQEEQRRLAYNYAWQKKHQQNRNQNYSSQSAAQARRNWQQQQARLLDQERSRAAQQLSSRKQQQFEQQQKILAKEYAAQQRQMQTRQYANQQKHKQAQQYAAQQRKRQAQQYRAIKMQRPTQRAAAERYAAQQMRQQAQRRSQQQNLQRQQKNNQAKYLAMLQERPRRTPNTAPQNNITALSPAEIRTIGDKIFRNESGGDIDKLVHWNVGENFASMGIGHFTWYPAGRRTRYGNTFPGLLDHLQANGVQLPAWVQKAKFTGAPWRTKKELMYAKNSPQVRQFQNLLYETRYLQASYIFERAKRAVPRLVKATPPHLRAHVAQNLNAVANTRGGWYALIDYVNFKGEGLNRKGGYKGQNWGLLQVLENMRPSQPGQMALNNFADSAIQVLERRIRNSNPSRGESRWMRGWAVRCNTYRQPFVI